MKTVFTVKNFKACAILFFLKISKSEVLQQNKIQVIGKFHDF